MTIVIVTGIWGSGKSHWITERLKLWSAQGRESVHGVGPATLSSVLAGPEANENDFAESCRRYVDLIEHESVLATRTLTRSRQATRWRPRWLLDGFVFNAPLYGFASRREEYLPMERRLADLGAVIAHGHVPSRLLATVSFERSARERGVRWAKFVNDAARRDGLPVQHFLESRQTALESWLDGSPIRQVEREKWSEDA